MDLLALNRIKLPFFFFSVRYPYLFWFVLSLLRKILYVFRIFFPDLLFRKVNKATSELPYINSSLHSTKAVVFCVHSFQLSGAEQYALDCARIADSRGLKVIWLVDYPTKYSQADDFLSVSNLTVHVWENDSPLRALREIAQSFDLDIVLFHIHHSVYAYTNLQFIKDVFRTSRVFDTLHIIEIGNRGFPRLSVNNTGLIDLHNVISQGLSAYLLTSGVSPFKLLRTVITPSEITLRHYKSTHFVIKFIGRLCLQKRSYLIPRYIHELAAKLNDLNSIYSIEVHVVGDGDLLVPLMRQKYPDNITVRFLGSVTNRNLIYEDADLVVQVSENEGVSVVSYECSQLKIPILATDVGEQRESIHQDMLLPLSPNLCIRTAVEKTVRLLTTPAYSRSVVDWQYENLNSLTQRYDFRESFMHIYKDIYEK